MALDIDPTITRGLDDHLGFTIEHADRDGMRGTLEVTQIHKQPFGITHGGVYCALAETAASVSAFCWLQESGIGGTAVGANNSTDFLRSVTGGVLSVSSTPIHRGRRQQLWQVDITDESGRLVAQSRVRMANIDMPEGMPEGAQ